MKNSADHLSSSPNASPDALRAWVQHHRDRFDTLAPPTDGWLALADALQAQAPREQEPLRAWTQHNRTAFDTLEPRADLWAAIESALDEDEVVAAPITAAPPLTAARGGQFAPVTAPVSARATWWRMAAAALVVFGLGYGLRLGTEPLATAPQVAASTIDDEPTISIAASADESSERYTARPLHGFRNQEPDPAVQAALLTAADDDVELSAATADARTAEPESSVELARLEARYRTLLAERQHDRAAHRPARPLADDWDREMALLDSTYAELRHALPTHPKPDEVVASMTRNLHLRAELLTKQEHALNAAQHARQQRGNRVTPRRPPTVNPDDNGVYFDDLAPSSSGGTLVPPAPPAPEPTGLGAGLKKRPSKVV